MLRNFLPRVTPSRRRTGPVISHVFLHTFFGTPDAAQTLPPAAPTPTLKGELSLETLGPDVEAGTSSCCLVCIFLLLQQIRGSAELLKGFKVDSARFLIPSRR